MVAGENCGLHAAGAPWARQQAAADEMASDREGSGCRWAGRLVRWGGVGGALASGCAPPRWDDQLSRGESTAPTIQVTPKRSVSMP